jgi:prepilin-type N-terminal cleavage/methylation domain-containing protein
MVQFTIMRAKMSLEKGFTFLEIMTVTSLIALLSVIAIPNYVRSREASFASVCMNNLRMLDGAKQQWGFANRISATTIPDPMEVQPYLNRSDDKLPFCPSDSQNTFDTSYTLNNLVTAPECKILPATHTYQK